MEIFDFSWLLALFVQYGHLLVFILVLLDNAGLPLPGELVLLAFGFLARTGHLDLGVGAMASGIGAMMGDNVSYWLGRLGGVRLLQTYCRMTLGSGECVSKALSFYHRFGAIAVILGRFVMGLRAFLVPLAGSARMPYGRFLLFDAIGAFFWSGLFLLAGYALGSQVEIFSHRFRRGSMLLAFALGIAFLVYLTMKLRKHRRYGPGLLERVGP